jgi:nitrate/nitrite transporter NarK
MVFEGNQRILKEKPESNNISNDFFAARYGMSQQNSARITSNVFLISAFLAPIFGVISDKIGHKVTFCIVSTTSLAM